MSCRACCVGVLAALLNLCLSLNVGLLNQIAGNGLMPSTNVKVVGSNYTLSLTSPGAIDVLVETCKLIYNGADVIVSNIEDPWFPVAYYTAAQHGIPVMSTTSWVLDSEKGYTWAFSVGPPFKASFGALASLFERFEWTMATVISAGAAQAETRSASLQTCRSYGAATNAFPYSIHRVPQLTTLLERMQWVQQNENVATSGYLVNLIYGNPSSVRQALEIAQDIGMNTEVYNWILFNHPVTEPFTKVPEKSVLLNLVPSSAGHHELASDITSEAIKQMALAVDKNALRKTNDFSIDACLSANAVSTSFRDSLINMIETGQIRIFSNMANMTEVDLHYDLYKYNPMEKSWSMVPNNLSTSETSAWVGVSDNPYKNRKPIIAGKHFIAYLSEEPPFINKLENGTYEGFMLDVLHEVSEYYGFTYDVKSNFFGGMDPRTGEWNGIFGELNKNWEAISIASTYATFSRAHHFDFTYPVWFTGYSFVLQKTLYDNDHIFIHPFDKYLWRAIFVTLLIIAILISLLNKVSPFDRRGQWIFAHEDIQGITSKRPRQRMYYKEQKRMLSQFSLQETLFFCLAIFTKSGWWTYPWSFSGRIVCVCLFVLTTTSISSYTAQLSARKTLAKLGSSVESLQDLVGVDNMAIGSTGNNTPLHEYVAKMERVKEFNILGRKLRDSPPLRINDGVEKARLDKNFAFVWTASVLDSAANSPPCNLRLGNKKFGTIMISFTLKKHSPYTTYFNEALIKLAGDNVLQVIMNKWRDKFDTCSGDYPGTVNVEAKDTADAEDMMYIFYVIGFSMAAGLIFLSFEMLYSLRYVPDKVKSQGILSMLRYRFSRVNRDLKVYYNPGRIVRRIKFKTLARTVSSALPRSRPASNQQEPSPKDSGRYSDSATSSPDSTYIVGQNDERPLAKPKWMKGYNDQHEGLYTLTYHKWL